MNGARVNLMSMITAWLLLAVLVMVGIWDVYTLLYGESGQSVSQYLHRLATAWPILPFAVGVLIGHLFWPVGRQG